MNAFIFAVLYLFAHSLKVNAVPTQHLVNRREVLEAYVPPLPAPEFSETVPTTRTMIASTASTEIPSPISTDASPISTDASPISTAVSAILPVTSTTVSTSTSLFCQNGDVKRHDIDCKEKFYYCMAGIWTETLCNTGLAHWIANNGITFPGVPVLNKTTLERVCCQNTETVLTKRSVGNDQTIPSKECTPGSVRAASSDCKQYFVCDESGVWIISSCPPNSLWNPLINRCDDRPHLDCEKLMHASTNRTHPLEAFGQTVQRLGQRVTNILRSAFE